ncbi:uncharacterized protein [Dasypus novemcinctus]|uniref:uncharacterized protein isoform X2 n=1 Tax=Dasypus novemcinctus TaxID=9361 RepID=UPI00265DC556|nr:uncharacterized protein LOC105745044 isoform X2 [Dasypus novemcinctus]
MGTSQTLDTLTLRSRRPGWRFGHRERRRAALGSRVSFAPAPPRASCPPRPQPPAASTYPRSLGRERERRLHARGGGGHNTTSQAPQPLPLPARSPRALFLLQTFGFYGRRETGATLSKFFPCSTLANERRRVREVKVQQEDKTLFARKHKPAGEGNFPLDSWERVKCRTSYITPSLSESLQECVVGSSLRESDCIRRRAPLRQTPGDWLVNQLTLITCAPRDQSRAKSFVQFFEKAFLPPL